MNNIKAQYYLKLDDKIVHCILCPHECRIRNGKRGICGVRLNMDGELFAESYGQVSALALDPIEKKPLFHFHPGSHILSAGSFGCNFSCSFCQNHQISMEKPQTAYVSPENLVYKANELKEANNIGIAYTYNEPFMSFEYVLDCCKLAKAKGLKNVLVTNGYIQEAPLIELLPYIDAMNIDLKSFNPNFYKKVCNGRIEFVKKTIEIAVSSCHVEITSLIIPKMNDTIEEIDALSSWLSSLSSEIPLHLSRFFPMYKMIDKKPTQKETLERLVIKAREHLRYVHVGNV